MRLYLAYRWGNMANLICTGCGTLCDDVQVQIEQNRITLVENACAKGAAFFHALDNPQRRTAYQVHHKEVPLDQAIEEAKRLLLRAKRPLILGLDNSTLAAQKKAICLAQKLGAVIDDFSSFSYGELIQSLLKGVLSDYPLSQIKDKADLLIYWGSNPLHSHPRHLSRFSYYSYTEYDEAGWVPKTKLSCVEVRDTELSAICNPAFKLPPGGDKDFVREILSLMKGKSGPEEARAFLELIRKSQFCVIFCGRGLVYSLNSDFDLFNEMIAILSQWNKVSIIPMTDDFNMLGFNKSLLEETGHINQVSFGGCIGHGSEFSILEQLRRGIPDCILILNSDYLSTLPPSLTRNLSSVNIICLGSLVTPTTDSADVVIATAAIGLECSGKVIRMDREGIELVKVRAGAYPSEEEVLEQLLEEVK